MESGVGPRLILASASPRRIDLLRDAGFEFDVAPARIEEINRAPLSVRELTLRNALRKACDVARRHHDNIILGADTLVARAGVIISKPTDLDDARRILRRLSGRTHQVCTSFVVVAARQAVAHCEISQVRFRALSDRDIADYFKRIDPLDKAGAYAAQGDGSSIIAKIEGSFSNVVGLPMEAVCEALAMFGVRSTR